MSRSDGEKFFQQGETAYFLGHNETAFNLFLQSAAQAYPPAYVRLCRMYTNGNWVLKSKENALEWEEKIRQNMEWLQTQAAAGEVEAQVCLGVCYERSVGINQDQKQAEALYRNAAQKNPIGAIGLMQYFWQRKDMKQVLVWARKAADVGFAEGQFYFGYCYENGLGMRSSDAKQAVSWYQKAIAQNHLPALCQLGKIYYEGREGVSQDIKQANALFQKAAEQGDADAQFILFDHLDFEILGKMFQIPEEQTERLNWLIKAATATKPNKLNIGVAQYALATCYSFHRLMIQLDRQQARFWFEKALANGIEKAKDRLDNQSVLLDASEADDYVREYFSDPPRSLETAAPKSASDPLLPGKNAGLFGSKRKLNSKQIEDSYCSCCTMQ